MPPRAIFKAVLHVGEVQAPVKLYSAIREERVHCRFRLHNPDLYAIFWRGSIPILGYSEVNQLVSTLLKAGRDNLAN